MVTWKSKKQHIVAWPSASAKFRGMTLGLFEVLWLWLFFQDLGYSSRHLIKLYCDNKALCDIAHNPIQHDSTKHIQVDGFFINEKLDRKILELSKIRSKDQWVIFLPKQFQVDYCNTYMNAQWHFGIFLTILMLFN